LTPWTVSTVAPLNVGGGIVAAYAAAAVSAKIEAKRRAVLMSETPGCEDENLRCDYFARFFTVQRARRPPYRVIVIAPLRQLPLQLFNAR
jgi:hypothetical protein